VAFGLDASKAAVDVHHPSLTSGAFPIDNDPHFANKRQRKPTENTGLSERTAISGTHRVSLGARVDFTISPRPAPSLQSPQKYSNFHSSRRLKMLTE
jgi:hypothetical protein